jgi:hypothetical protein
MKTINLGRIIELAGLNKKDLAELLFPDLKHPNRSLSAVISGILHLNTVQIVKLSNFLDVPVGMLFDDASWSMGVPKDQAKRVIQFKAYNYFAELDLATMTTSISKDGLTFLKTVKHSPSVELSAYLSDLTDLIIKHK